MHSYFTTYRSIARQDLKDSIQEQTDLEHRATRDVKRLPPLKGLRVLEVGPGQGHLARKISALGAELDLVDIVPDYVDKLGAEITGRTFVSDAHELEGLEQYDLVVSCDVMEHVLRPGDFLLALKKSLKPGGLLYIRVPSWESLIKYARQLGCPWEFSHLRTYTPSLLRLELVAAGFSVRRGPTGRGASARVLRGEIFSSSVWDRKRIEVSEAWGQKSSTDMRQANPQRTAVNFFHLVEKVAVRLRLPVLTRPAEIWSIAQAPK